MFTCVDFKLVLLQTENIWIPFNTQQKHSALGLKCNCINFSYFPQAFISKSWSVITTPLTRWQCCLVTGLFTKPERVIGRQSPPHFPTTNAKQQWMQQGKLSWWMQSIGFSVLLFQSQPCLLPALPLPVSFCNGCCCCCSPSPLNGVGRVGWTTALETFS